MDKKKLFMYIKRITTGSLAFGLSLVGAYILAPNKVKTVDIGGNSSIILPEEEGGDTTPYFNALIDHVKGAADAKSEAEITPLHISFEDFSVSFGDKDELNSTWNNNIGIEGDIMFSMKTLNNMKFTVDLDVNYDERHIPLAVGLVGSDFYLQFKDIKLKSTGENTESILDLLGDLFFISPGSEEAGGLNMEIDVDKIIDVVLGKVDITSLLSSSNGSSMGFSITEGKPDSNGNVVDKIVVTKTDEEGNTSNFVDITMLLKVDEAAGRAKLKTLDLGTIDLGSAVIKGKLNFEYEPDKSIVPFDNSNYHVGNFTSRSGFQEMIGYVGWAHKLLKVMKSRNLGLDFDATLSTTEGDLITNIFVDLDLDASVLIPSFQDLILHEKLEELLAEDDEENQEPEETMTDKFLNKLAFGLDVSIEGNDGNENANLGVHYANQAGYITLNEDKESVDNKASMRAKVTARAIKDVIALIPESVEAEVQEQVQEVTESPLTDEEAEEAEGFFDFITETLFMKAIKRGEYGVILDLIKSMSNDSNSITLALDLSKLGFGDEAEVVVVLDSRNESNVHVLNVTASHIVFKSLELGFTLNTRDFSNTSIEHVVSNDAKYDELNYLPSIFDQVQGILDAKKTGFTLKGTVVGDVEHTGIEIDGWGQFDYNTKYGYGLLNLYEHDTAFNEGDPYKYNHRLKLDVDNQGAELAENNIKIAYGANDGIKAFSTVRTMKDLFKVVTKFVGDNKDNPRYTKFIDPLLDTLGISYVGDIINSKNYTKFVSNEVIKEIKETEDGSAIKISIGGAVMALPEGTDLNIYVNFNGTGEDRTIKSIEVRDLTVSGKIINVTLGLTDFDELKLSPLKDMNITDSNVLNFSQLDVLLDLGLNTTNQGYYHLTGDIALKLGDYDAMTFQLDFNIQVNGDETKVYGRIPKLPTIPLLGYLVVNDNGKDTETEFVFEPYNSNEDKIGGYFHILRHYDEQKGIFNRYTQSSYSYYKTTSKNFLDADNNGTNLLIYLLEDMLNVKQTWVDMIVDKINDPSADNDKASNYEAMFQDGGFSYDSSKANNGVITHHWGVGINLGELLGMSALGVLNADIYGTQASESAKGYLNRVVANMDLVSVLTISADLQLTNAGSNVETWGSTIEGKYNTVIATQNRSGYSDATYLNKPRKAFTYTIKH